MSESKPYKEQESETQCVSEAAVMYGISDRSVDDFVASIPKDLMRRMIDVAIRDCKEGKGIPHAQMDEYLKERMGWK